jgi:hypothetical protein
MSLFIEEICWQYALWFDIHLDRTHFLDLDSTTDTKFSRHLIIHAPGNALWENNVVLGHWFATVVSAMKGEINSYSERGVVHPLSKLWCKSGTDTEEHKFIVDCGVYTKNRAMRLYMSSKYGKTSRLALSKTNTFPIPATFIKPEDCDLYILRKSLVCDFQEVPQGTNQHRLMIPYALPHTTGVGKRVGGTTDTSTRISSAAATGRGAPSVQSPYPLLDSFILSLCDQTGTPGAIKNVIATNEYITYNVTGNRFCRRINRPHKSNHIYFVVDISKLCVWQRCYDPDCRSFRSPPIFFNCNALLQP